MDTNVEVSQEFLEFVNNFNSLEDDYHLALDIGVILQLFQDDKEYPRLYPGLESEILHLGQQYGFDRPIDHLLNPDFFDDLGVKTVGQMLSNLRDSVFDEQCNEDNDRVIVGRAEYEALMDYLSDMEPK